MALFSVFINLFNVWLNRRKLIFISASTFDLFCYHMPLTSEKFYFTLIREWGWKMKMTSYYYENSFDLADCLKVSQRPPGLLRPQFKVSWYRLLSPNIKRLDLVFSVYIMATTFWIIKHKPLNYKKEEVQTCLHPLSTSIHVCLQGTIYFQEYLRNLWVPDME